MAWVTIAFGWTLAKLPSGFCQALCWFLGSVFYAIPSTRKHILLSNLHHAFPDKGEDWLQNMAYKICLRTAEMGLFTLVCPHFSEERFKKTLKVSPEAEARMQALCERGRPVVFFSAHFSMIEAFNAWPAIAKFSFPEMAIMYRPYKNPRIDQLLLRHRERFGLKLVSRKTGIRTIGEVLRSNGVAGVLFDQNTRDNGTLIPFFDRVTSATELPEILTQKYHAIPAAMTTFSSGFWQGDILLDELDPEANGGNLTLTANQWLESILRKDEALCIDWLWTHNRWKILHQPHERLGMRHKRKAFDFATIGLRKTRIALFHSEPVEAIDAIRKFAKALRQSRPDVELTLVGNIDERTPSDFLCDCGFSIKGKPSSAQLKELKIRYLDTALVLQPTPELSKWAARAGIPQRFGVTLPGQKASFLSESWTPEDPENWQAEPDWISFGKQFGLESGDDSNSD
jgi:lauroyl/myristoyl acyltransferase